MPAVRVATFTQLSIALHGEASSAGIRVRVIEPGRFRLRAGHALDDQLVRVNSPGERTHEIAGTPSVTVVEAVQPGVAFGGSVMRRFMTA